MAVNRAGHPHVDAEIVLSQDLRRGVRAPDGPADDLAGSGSFGWLLQGVLGGLSYYLFSNGG